MQSSYLHLKKSIRLLKAIVLTYVLYGCQHTQETFYVPRQNVSTESLMNVQNYKLILQKIAWKDQEQSIILAAIHVKDIAEIIPLSAIQLPLPSQNLNTKLIHIRSTGVFVQAHQFLQPIKELPNICQPHEFLALERLAFFPQPSKTVLHPLYTQLQILQEHATNNAEIVCITVQ